MALEGKWHRALFVVSAAALLLSAYAALKPSQREELEAFEYKVELPPAPGVSKTALPDSEPRAYWKAGRMVWVQPAIKEGPVRIELRSPRPTLAVPPMPLPDPSPLLEHSRGLPRWGDVPEASLEEEE